MPIGGQPRCYGTVRHRLVVVAHWAGAWIGEGDGGGQVTPPTSFEWFSIAQAIAFGVAGAIAWRYGRRDKQADSAAKAVQSQIKALEELTSVQLKRIEETLNARLQRIEERHEDIENTIKGRFERINAQLSAKLLPALEELKGRVDRMPEDLRTKFMPLDRATDMLDSSLRDRAELNRSVSALWVAINELRAAADTRRRGR